MPYILLILSLLFGNLITDFATPKQTEKTTKKDRTNPGDDRDYIIVEMTTP